MSANAEQFVGPLTFRTLSGRPVLADLFDPQSPDAVEHVALAERAAALVVAPATANLLGKAAHGIADDFLTTLLLAMRGPVLMAPAMDGGMWTHPAVVANVATLRGRGVCVLEPDPGALASGLHGSGRLPEVEAIVEALTRLLNPTRDLAGDRVLITAGPTREPIDPVRFISNRSSGKMGYAIAEAALAAGHEVTLISGPVNLEAPRGTRLIPAPTGDAMFDAVREHADQSDICVLCAAVADYKPANVSSTKIKKQNEKFLLELIPTRDILNSLGQRRDRQFALVGFAAETGHVEENAAKKLRAKNCDIMV